MSHNEEAYVKQIVRLFFIFIFLGLSLQTAQPTLAASYGFGGTIASGAQYDLYFIDLVEGEHVVAITHCGIPPNNTLDTVLSVYFPGSDSSSTSNADVYNDDGGDEDCGSFDNSVLEFTAPAAGQYTFRVDGFGSSTGGYSLNIGTDLNRPLAADGRINPDGAAPVVVYCVGTSSHLYSVTGTDLGTVKNGGSRSIALVTVSPLPNGQMQLTAPMKDGKTYLLVWDGCPTGTSISYTIENGNQLQFSSWDYDASSQGHSSDSK
jgi:hypothetical protein